MFDELCVESSRALEMYSRVPAYEDSWKTFLKIKILT